MKNDYLVKAVDNQKQIRVIISRTTNIVEEARRRHGTSATASAALGRVLTAAVMLGSDLKNDGDSLTIRVNGYGISGPIIATANSTGHVRGYVSNPLADLPSVYPGKLAVGKLVGKEGFLEVVKDIGFNQPFRGMVPLVSGEIAEDLAQYLLGSEQVPSLVSLGVLVATDLSIAAAGGLIVQALPGASEDIIKLVEDNILEMGPISNSINNSESLESLLTMALRRIDYTVIDQKPLAFKCNCSYERIARILAGLPDEELDSINEERGCIEVCCNFCNQIYRYQREEVFGNKNNKP
ncbi:MAG: Hsp33 family molecular chaperone HslO [Syntrophomonadaceae bacterium]|jgi:molecular chaperone Hsp33